MPPENRVEDLSQNEAVYEAPQVESVLTDEDLSRELHYAGGGGPTPIQ